MCWAALKSFKNNNAAYEKKHAPFKLNGQSRTAFGLLKAPELQRLSGTVEVLRVGAMIVGVISVGVMTVGVMTLSRIISQFKKDKIRKMVYCMYYLISSNPSTFTVNVI